MDRTEKFILSLPKKDRYRLREVIDRILSGNLSSLDVRPLVGFHNVFRCRMGSVRIIFKARAGAYTIVEVGFRKDVYKRMK